MLDKKRFTKNDSGFVCQNCKAKVPPLSYSSRDHCSKCLCSLHVDINPGDRQNPCGGIMDAIFAEPSPDGYVITHKCRRCGFARNNKYQKDDDTELLIKLSNPYNIQGEPI